MSDNKPRGRRRRFFIARPIQGALVIRFVGYWAAYCLLSLLVGITITYFGNVITGSQNGIRESLKDQIPFLISAFVLMPILVNDLVRFSQRFTGPICHLQNEIRRFNSGDEVKPVQFRSTDYWQDLPADFNEFTQKTRAGVPPNSERAEAANQNQIVEESGYPEELREPSVDTLAMDTADH